jgi:hypothetical protein
MMTSYGKDMTRNRKGRATEKLVNAKHRTYLRCWNARNFHEIIKATQLAKEMKNATWN